MSGASLFKSSLVMAVATFCSRILGLVREQLMAAYFGASGLTDAFLVAYRIPNLMRDLFAEGAFSSAFVPTFAQARTESEDVAKKLLWELVVVLGAITLALSLAIFFFAPELIDLFAPGFIHDPEKRELTIQLTRILSPFLFFISLAALFMGALNSLGVFFIPSLAPAAYNVMCILSILTLTGFFITQGIHPVLALGVGALLGGIAQALVQIPLLIKKGYGPRRIERVGTPLAKKVLTLLGPGLLGFAATQINLLATTILATSAAVGATSWLNYAFRLFQLPVGILSVSIGNSNLVFFSKAWKSGDKKTALDHLKTSYELSFFVVLLPMILMWFMSEQVIAIVYERGEFTRASTQMTALAMRMYALGLPLYSLYKIWVPTFYALDRQKIPVYSSLVSIGLNVLFCIVMTPVWGFQVLALGTTLSMLLNCLILGAALKRELDLSWRFFLSARLGKLLLAFVITALACQVGVAQFFPLGLPLIEALTRLVSLTIASGFIYGGMCMILGEAQILQRAVPEKMRKFLRIGSRK
jgi:putative peptidoglycan lipid II flippase